MNEEIPREDVDLLEEEELMQKKRRRNRSIIILLVVLGLFYFCTGFVVQQPIGAIPNGATAWVLRMGTDLPFVCSADGLALKATGQVSLLSRAQSLKHIGEQIDGRVLVRLPYMKWLYLWSTGGVEFEK